MTSIELLPRERALVAAARAGDLRRVEALLAEGVPAGVVVEEPSRNGGVLSAVGAAAGSGHAGVVRALLDAGASPSDATALLAVTAIPQALDAPHRAVLELLLAAGQPGWILRVALGQRLEVEDPEAVARLLAAGAPPDPTAGWGGTGGSLYACLWHGRSVAVLRLLLDAGADAARRDRGGRTPFALARRVADDEAAAELEARGAGHADDPALDALLHAAARGEHAEVVRRRTADDPARRLTPEDHVLLVRAVRRGHSRALDALLAAGLDPAVPDVDGATALHAAAAADDDGAVRTLVAAGARLVARDHRGHTPVAVALAETRRRAAAALLELHERSARTGAPHPLGETASFPTGDEALDARLAGLGARPVPAGRDARFERAVTALVAGDEQALTVLLDEDPGLPRARSPRPHHATLLHYLGANGVEDHVQRTPPNAPALVRLLAARGAEADATCDTYGGGTAQTTLCLAASSGRPAEAGLHRPLIEALVAAGARVDGLRGDGEPLATAIAFRQADAAAALVAAGARLDALPFAAASGDPARVSALLGDGAGRRPDAARCRVPWLLEADDPCAAAGQALVVAAQLGHDAVVDGLLARGVDPSSALGAGNTALHEAAHAGHLALVERLLDAGADPTLRDGEWRSTPLVWAHVGGRADVARRLLARAGADLVDCAELGLVDVARRALEAGADPEGPRADGLPLRSAAAGGRAELVRLLLEHGADPTRTDAHGWTAAAYARRHGHAELADLLAPFS